MQNSDHIRGQDLAILLKPLESWVVQDRIREGSVRKPDSTCLLSNATWWHDVRT
jgi:hypothetical protein